MSTQDISRELASLLKRLRADHAGALDAPAPLPAIDAAEPILGLLVRSFLMWDATTAKAALAMRRIEGAVVDFNELRICMPDEIVRMLGERYPRAEERAVRLRCALNDVYRREHRVGLEHLAALPKREAREYLETLDGAPRYAASRVGLLALDIHAAPVDGRIAHHLVEAGLLTTGASTDEAAAFLERKVRADDLREVYTLLQAYADDASITLADGPAETGRPASRSVWSRHALRDPSLLPTPLAPVLPPVVIERKSAVKGAARVPGLRSPPTKRI